MNVFKQQAGQYLGDQAQLEQDLPGRAAGGAGDTGLLPNDAQGYAQMLEGQQAQLGLANFLNGGSPEPNVRLGRELPSTRSLTEATGYNNDIPSSGAGLESMQALDEASMPGYESHDQFMGRYGRKAR